MTTACPDRRFIGRVGPGHSCPAPSAGSSWSDTRLFDDPAAPSAPIPATLEPFCLYEWTGSAPDPTALDLAALPDYANQTAGDWLHRDCWVVSGQSGAGNADAALDRVFQGYRAAFRTQAERPLSLPAATGDVWVSIVDSWPVEDPAPGLKTGQNTHGLAMAQIISDLVCHPLGYTGPGCPVRWSRHLALNLDYDGSANEKEGGFFGYQGRLAQTIREAVRMWKDNGSLGSLIISLAVGWDPVYNTGSPLDPPGTSEAVSAVQVALEHARCEGALIIVAAGNLGSGPSPSTGPLMPAALAATSAPVGCGTGPLLYAASGVDGRDDPLTNQRVGARAELNAPAFNVVAELIDPLGNVTRVSPLTGSSVAAATTTAAAATALIYDPALDPDSVMQVVYAAAEDLGWASDFCFGPACANARRVSICRTADAILGSLSCSPIAAGSGQNVQWSPAAAADIAALGTFGFDGTFIDNVLIPVGCTDGVAVPTGLTSYPGPWGCPEAQLPNRVEMPYVNPQPEPDPCRACGIELAHSVRSDLVYIAVEADWRGSVYPEQLTLNSRAGVVLHRWNLAGAVDTSGYALGHGLTPGDVYAVELDTAGLTTTVSTATIQWLDSRSSTRSTASSEISVF